MAYTRLAAADAGEAIFLFKELGLTGMNVTAPFKNEIMPFLDEIEDAGAAVGGINTVVSRIVNQKCRLNGFNTDIAGVADSFTKRGIDISSKTAVVLGAGGAGRAAAYALKKSGAHVIIVNRTYEKAVQAAQSLNCSPRKLEDLETLLNQAHIFVSTLSAALDIIPALWLKKELVVFDANYKKSPLCRKARERGCTVLRGEEWLLNQAIPAYCHFTRSSFDDSLVPLMQDALRTTPFTNVNNIALTGFMGCGKTTVGKLLAAKTQSDFADIDQLIEEHEGKPIARIFSDHGEPYFREVEKAILKRELENRTRTVFSCGGGAVLDDSNKTVLQKNALTVWLYSSIPTTLKRVANQPGTRPLLDCPDPGTAARELLENRLIHYTRAADLVAANEKAPETAAEKIYDELKQIGTRYQ